ncbi:AraC family transcriptional regulator [Streptomyces nitrosporeus]|uniref:AraC family transcriptional regulator n=1 Tax=Streptomyces nitrosporeus TaxID=28894 RepID=A0A5J6FDM1_9ACTN|nr:helix-turn-helix domain-containing protein [Streptomyces nitrosporeus]QEU73907.1 AraC family transcriptional regulator [Streptomyces nitrosporeus]GGZ01319.1 AraC family transcriptional regulator [Streptomyces nitrosporeus]
MAGSRRDTRGIVDAPALFSRVRFRRRDPAPALRPFVEHYWLIDWDLTEPYTSRVVPHPSVHLVFQRDEEPGGPGPADRAEVHGIVRGLFTRRLTGRGRVCGVKFRPGGFWPFAPERPVSEWTGRYVPAAGLLPAPPSGEVLGPPGEDARVAALDAYLLPLVPAFDPRTAQVTALAELVRTDRALLRVDTLARTAGMSARSLQRLFATRVGVGPKWVILRHRIHEALERAAAGPEADWAGLAADLGYSDQAHLVRDFTATVGVPPAAFARD